MANLLIPTLLIIVLALAACADPTPTQEAAVTPAPDTAPVTAPPPANTPEPTAPSEPEPTAPTEEPTEVITPPPAQEQEALLSSLSEAELACIGGDPERMLTTLTGGAPASMEEQAQLIGCLDDDTVDLIFMTTIIPIPLSMETSTCILAALDVIDPRAVMNAGLEGDPQTAMAGSMAAFTVSVACLNDEEWTAAAPRLGMEPEDRGGMVCIMAALRGPTEMATAMTEAMEAEGVAEGTALHQAGLECGMEPGPEPITTPEPATATPTIAPKATTVAPTPTAEPPTPVPTPAPKPTRTPPTPVATPPNTLVITVADIPQRIPEYDRSDWKHWTDEDGDCQDARQEVLIAESLEPVEYEDDSQCRVAWGRWWAPYLAHHLGNPSHIDVDHMVPLRNAHLSRGWAWDAERKEAYANYLGDDAHLVAISSRHNRSKGARGPEEWAPPDNDLWCQYALDWAEIKQRWGLTMTQVESEIVMDMLGTCEDPPEFQVETLEYPETVTRQDKPTAKPEETVYESCEEAATAGQERVQGSRGGGRGFPAAMVPSARDGDGDAVVCEQ